MSRKIFEKIRENSRKNPGKMFFEEYQSIKRNFHLEAAPETDCLRGETAMSVPDCIGIAFYADTATQTVAEFESA